MDSVVHATERHSKQQGALLSDFMSRVSPRQIAEGIGRRLPGVMEIQTCSPLEANGTRSDVLLLTMKRRVYLGPRALDLWMQPKVVMWLRFKGKSITCEAHVCGDESSASGAKCRVSQLKVNTKVTWVEESIKHLQGDCVPCLLLKSQLRAGLELHAAGSRWLRLLPSSLLLTLSRRAVAAALHEMQSAIAGAMLSEYEDALNEWRGPSQGPIWQ